MGKFLDMWYGDRSRDADKIDIFFSDLDCIYRGNIYKNGHIVGDYSAKETKQIEKMFPQLAFNWNWPARWRMEETDHETHI